MWALGPGILTVLAIIIGLLMFFSPIIIMDRLAQIRTVNKALLKVNREILEELRNNNGGPPAEPERGKAPRPKPSPTEPEDEKPPRPKPAWLSVRR